ncbi:Uma2 family endonuclease [Streptomyces hoynatensis]|uniref:Uma2 family endonuclease n=1 Tax=Streptomyces hoynatensis TaxID=1141874 RepID=A0A3A9ZEA3_9ACTN|nr:Uma2 family endonuclease [Streptomyces hoynatensis]RKN46801.1 Uma2 family endonuclease [Streptomyces hoynatensis]
MAAEPMSEPKNRPTDLDPVELLAAYEAAAPAPLRHEYYEGALLVTPYPDRPHNRAIRLLVGQFEAAGFDHVGFGEGFRFPPREKLKASLAVPDFNVLHREPTDLDEQFRRANGGWYSSELLALVGEVTSTNHEFDTGPKFRTYAASGVPVYVVIHRQEGKAYAYREPVPGEARYEAVEEVKLGDMLPLPAPYPSLDTSVALSS